MDSALEDILHRDWRTGGSGVDACTDAWTLAVLDADTAADLGAVKADAERRRRGSVISRAVGVLLRLDRTHRIFRHVVKNIHRATTTAASHPTFDYPRGVSTGDASR